MTKKPILYEAACIFSIIGSSIGFVSMFITTFFFKIVTEKISLLTNITATEKLSPIYFALLGTVFCISLVGAIKLYRMRRSGIYFYLMAQAVILFLPVIWLGSNAFSVTNAIFTLLFSGVYIYYYRITV
ncbi:MAG TPA: hypothetical protein VFC65_15750 [Prolixibacteraceae bacterium]|nr:hypothetical protein [Prolixibacteraceae bacterium]